VDKLDAAQKLRLGQLLVQDERLSEQDLARVLGEQQRLNSKSKRQFKLGEIALFLGLITPKELEKYLLNQRSRSLREINDLETVRKIHQIKQHSPAPPPKPVKEKSNLGGLQLVKLTKRIFPRP